MVVMSGETVTLVKSAGVFMKGVFARAGIAVLPLGLSVTSCVISGSILLIIVIGHCPTPYLQFLRPNGTASNLGARLFTCSTAQRLQVQKKIKNQYVLFSVVH